MIYDLFLKVVDFVDSIGYIGVFIMTFIESTFIPIPSEVTLIPAGYLISEGKMNFWILNLCAIIGTISGSLFNYWIARKFGRKLLLKYGRYFFINKHKLRLIEVFFEKHGKISTFSGRLLPGIKHFISFPAGLANMNLKLFITYTALGGAIFNTILIILGYYIGENKALINKYMWQINIGIVVMLLIILFFYISYKRKNKNYDIE